MVTIASNEMTPRTCFWRHFAAVILPPRCSYGDLFEWRCSSFFCCLLEIVDFQAAAILSSVCRSLLSFKTTKWGETWTLTSADDLTLHAKPLHRAPVISSPKPFLDQLWRSTVRLQRSLAEVHTMELHLSTAECRKNTKNSFQASRSGPQRIKKITSTSTLTGRPRARTPSSTSAAVFSIGGAHPALRFFLCLLQLSRRPGNLFYLFTPDKNKPKKPTRCTNHGLQTCLMSCMQHTPACITCM